MASFRRNFRAQIDYREQAKAVEEYGRGGIPICVESVPGLYLLDDRDGQYRDAKDGEDGVWCLHSTRKLIVTVVPAVESDIVSGFERQYEKIPWAQRNKCEVCGKFVGECKCASGREVGDYW